MKEQRSSCAPQGAMSRKDSKYFLKGCSLLVFKGVLNNLQSLERD